MERPAPHSFAPRYGWEHCDVEGLEGFAIYVRRGITNREREDLNEAHQAIVEYEVAYVKSDPKKRDHDDTPRKREMALIAPFIKDWNAVGLDADGNDAPIPAPADAGPDAFLAIEPEAYDWIVRHILLGYRASGKAGGWGVASPRSAAPRPAGSDAGQS